MTTIHEVQRSTGSAKMEHPNMKGSGVTNWEFWFPKSEAEEMAIDSDPTGEATGWSPITEG